MNVCSIRTSIPILLCRPQGDDSELEVDDLETAKSKYPHPSPLQSKAPPPHVRVMALAQPELMCCALCRLRASPHIPVGQLIRNLMSHKQWCVVCY